VPGERIGGGCSPAVRPLWTCRQWSGAASAGSIPQASTASIALRTSLTLGQPSIRRRISPPGRTNGRVEWGSPGVTARDVDARDDRAEVVGRPAHEGEDGAGREADDAPAAVDDCLLGDAAEAVQCSMRFSSQVNSARVRSFLLSSVRQSAAELAFIARLHRFRGIRARAARAACRRRSGRAERRRP
jgi:hypothetical protein